MDAKSRLIEKLREIWDLDNLNSQWSKVFPETLKECDKAIDETVDFILSRDRQITIQRSGEKDMKEWMIKYPGYFTLCVFIVCCCITSTCELFAKGHVEPFINIVTK